MSYKYAPKGHNVHHKLCKSRGGNNEEDNLDRIRIKLHTALHQVFGNDTTSEKIARVLEMDLSVLQGDFINDVMNILERYGNDVYHNHVTK